jgi:hypothetical protein
MIPVFADATWAIVWGMGKIKEVIDVRWGHPGRKTSALLTEKMKRASHP